MAWGARQCAASATSATVRSHGSASCSVATRKWCRGPDSPLARYTSSKALRIPAGGVEVSVHSRSHGNAPGSYLPASPGSYLPASPGQMVACKVGRSLQRTWAIGSRRG